MPTSSPLGKQKTIAFILEKFSKEARILDIGCGMGTYSDLLRPLGYSNINGVEVWPPYIETYNLRKKYNTLFECNVMEMRFGSYNLVILGDVLEHLSIPDAQRLIGYLQKNADCILVSVPYNLRQDAYGGNQYEIHQQTDVNEITFKERYPGFLCLSEERDSAIRLGVWIWTR